MRQIGSIENDHDAERFSDYLVTQGIGNMVEEAAAEGGGSWLVWVENDDHIDRARTELERFKASVADPRYDAARDAQALRKETEKTELRRREKFVDVRTGWSRPAQFAKPVTLVLAIVSILASLGGTKLGLVEEPTTPLTNAFLIAPVQELDNGWIQWDDLDAIHHGQVWRLVTPIFLHFSPLHLVFNLYWLFHLGAMIETRRGSVFMAVLVLVTAVASNVGQYYLGDWGHPSPMFGGMSGVNYALFGYAWLKGRFQPYLGMGVASQTVMIMLVWLVVCMTGAVGAVANAAHVVGLAGGAAFAFLPYAAGRLKRR